MGYVFCVGMIYGGFGICRSVIETGGGGVWSCGILQGHADGMLIMKHCRL